MYRVGYEKRVLKDLDKISNTDVKKISVIFKELSFNPNPIGCKKLSGKRNLYRVRQGDYRILYIIDYREKEVKIILVSHRSKAYRNL